MKSRLHHAALNVCDWKWYTAFFQEIFGMEIQRTDGTAPNRRIWFAEGIQLNECREEPEPGGACDHISIGTPDIPGTVEAAVKAGCTPLPNGSHWFALPNGVKIELKSMD